MCAVYQDYNCTINVLIHLQYKTVLQVIDISKSSNQEFRIRNSITPYKLFCLISMFPEKNCTFNLYCMYLGMSFGKCTVNVRTMY